MDSPESNNFRPTGIRARRLGRLALLIPGWQLRPVGAYQRATATLGIPRWDRGRRISLGRTRLGSHDVVPITLAVVGPPAGTPAPAQGKSIMRILQVHNLYRSAYPSGENRVVDLEYGALRSHGYQVEQFQRSSDTIDTWPARKKALLPARMLWRHGVLPGPDPRPADQPS